MTHLTACVIARPHLNPLPQERTSRIPVFDFANACLAAPTMKLPDVAPDGAGNFFWRGGQLMASDNECGHRGQQSHSVLPELNIRLAASRSHFGLFQPNRVYRVAQRVVPH